ncbi:hypothetical protein T190115A13A_160099 [Tenacibaculum sp. 190524A02b]|uniref:Uncharacterized protein n=1 Tax=Tenacibaculum vairaonense TaxID=3137860 RepID=A0ABM9PIW7_9FLAO
MCLSLRCGALRKNYPISKIHTVEPKIRNQLHIFLYICVIDYINKSRWIT